MYNNKLIRLLQSFERKEMTRFREFAFSPYFNKHEGVRRLVAYFSDIFPDFGEQNCHREVAFQVLFPGQPHDQNRLALVFTYTMRLAEQFLKVEQAGMGNGLSDTYLLQQLRTKKLFQLYERVLDKTTRTGEETGTRDSHWYYQQYLSATEADQYFNTVSERRTDDSLQRKQYYLDRFYLAEKLRDACEMQVRSRILKVSYSDPLQETALAAVEAHWKELEQEPAIAMYYWLYRMVSNPAPSFYFESLRALNTHQSALPGVEQKAIYNYLQNYCIQKINEGQARFLAEIFELYKAQLERGLLLENELLSEWHYKNIVTTGIRLREMDWVRGFIEGYREKLPEEARDNAYRFNLASYFYATQQYGEVLRLLTQVEYRDLRYSLGAKALLLRTYYDLDEYEALSSLADSFKQYLHRNQLMADVRREGYHNLFKLTRRAANLRANIGYFTQEKSRKELLKLQRSIEKAGAIFNKSWLLEKVEHLEALL
ncbi:MAG: hypothetical protein KDD19_21350 [Phaeodactylibacter sp.]|nr:hypothetical protein [Phaeodactylibacter sp.]MCB9049837.1 hypothetical protein [Lewinellaceae bacterium]